MQHASLGDEPQRQQLFFDPYRQGRRADAIRHQEPSDCAARGLNPEGGASSHEDRVCFSLGQPQRGVTRDGAQWVVTAGVSGNFPGSPVQLTYHFTLQEDKIARLLIKL